MILSDSWISLKLILIDFQWFLNKSEIDSHWFCVIPDDSQISLKLILINSRWFSSQLERGDSQLKNGNLFVKIG